MRGREQQVEHSATHAHMCRHCSERCVQQHSHFFSSSIAQLVAAQSAAQSTLSLPQQRQMHVAQGQQQRAAPMQRQQRLTRPR